MELKIFRDTLPQAGASCTVKAELRWKPRS